MSDVCADDNNNNNNLNDNFTARSILAKQAVEDFLAAEIAEVEGGNATAVDELQPNLVIEENDDTPSNEGSWPKRCYKVPRFYEG